MKTKIGIISDIHATAQPVAEALELFERERVTDILCAGDIVGYGDELDETVELLAASSCLAVIGNHDEWFLSRTATDIGSASHHYLKDLPTFLEMTLEGKVIYMVHASPPDSVMAGVRLLDENGVLLNGELDYWTGRFQPLDCDLLVVGHTHQVFAERIGSTLAINPGSTLFNHSCAVVSVPSLHVEWFALSGQTILKSWNWGMVRNSLPHMGEV